ncbi:MAG TPA: bifunctional nicotinamidase/pyrazinamidase [Blastocatellia bacterium]|nr:bifunctional nicotinamidase/pyrazinamidase [Blastocatellia bacterium]
MKEPLQDAALVLVDIQNDFCPGGALAVNEGDQIVGVVNRLIHKFPFVVTTQDWHPANHISFKERGGPWPPHCVQGTRGAELHPALDRAGIDYGVRKGQTSEQDAYSGFEGTDEAGRTLDEVLKGRNVEKVYVAGLATDYCVRATVLDALKNGYEVYAITDAMRAVNVNPDDGTKALQEMASKGAHLTTSSEVVKRDA